MSYTIKNLDSTEDSAVKFGLAEIGEAHFPREELDAERTGFAYHVLKPGKRQAFGHRHEQAEDGLLRPGKRERSEKEEGDDAEGDHREPEQLEKRPSSGFESFPEILLGHRSLQRAPRCPDPERGPLKAKTRVRIP